MGRRKRSPEGQERREKIRELLHLSGVSSMEDGLDAELSEELGYSTAAFTLDVYGHVTSKMKQESASRMERFIQGDPPLKGEKTAKFHA